MPILDRPISLCVISRFYVLFAFTLVTFLIFPIDSIQTDQYLFFIPKQGTFTHDLFKYSPLITAVFYAILNALAIAIFTAITTELHIIFNMKNRYFAIAVPVLLFYLLNFIFDTISVISYKYNISLILQPLSTNALEVKITSVDVIAVYIGLACIVGVLFVICVKRSKNIL